ncbi:CHAT domain-containing protein [Aggregatilinea lenta]|uniref:CHAT domain-containing protein n=1 Tax=Aggregatilinea lenta TaxID=913108 RepID=UPI000E5B4962|nr:CHAT domain-containing protein [Aggregatilinea lenta]
MITGRPYLDFELRIDDLGGGRYRATVAEMPLGEGQVSNEFTLPLADDDLRRTLAILSGTTNAPEAVRDATARSFGEALFGAVFDGPVYTVYFSSRDRASDAAGLRVKLSLDNAGALATLPWEFLRDPAVDYLALSSRTPLVRYPRRLTQRPKPSFALPLRVLVMISSPRDMPPIDEQAEWDRLLAATEPLRKRGVLELVLLEDASLRTLQRVLRSGEFHVFHYIGHSTYDPVTHQGMIALEDPYGEGSSFPVRGEDLARELSEENAIRLAVLNSCQSATEPGTDPFAGIASSLVQRGIPAVIAMQTVIGEEAARAFSEELYRAVAEGLPVDAALSEARRAIDHAVGGIEWATPVLYMRAADGVLFEITAARATHRPAWRQQGVILPVAAVLVMMALVAGLLLVFRPGGDTPEPTPNAALDLVIDSIEVFPPNPLPGEKAAVIVHVTNGGSGPVGPFSYDFSQDVLDATPSFTGESTGLAAGDSASLFIPHAFNWWGAFVSEVRIDVTSAVPETDEFNNTARYPVVTADGDFLLTFDTLPGGIQVEASMPLPADAFSKWGFRFEVVPGSDEECEGAVPWIVVEGESRHLGTGLPDSPDVCTSGSLVFVDERSPVSGVIATFDVPRTTTYRMTAFNTLGTEIDIAADEIGPGQGTLEISGGFPTRLEIARAVIAPIDDGPLRIKQIDLAQPARLSTR